MTAPDDLLDASIQTLAYVIMALGLNIVVGFAGLLDLGYVAFFAIGAFVMGWLGSQQFGTINHGKGIHILTPVKSAFGSDIPGIHINFFLVLLIAMVFTAGWGVILGAPTLRLRGDYLAIVTLAFGEIVPRVFENSTSGIFGIGQHGLLQRPAGDHADRQDQPALDGHEVQLPAGAQARLLRRAGHGPARDVLQPAPARLAAGAGVDRRPRGRGRRGGSMGVNLVRTKLWAYAIGAALGGFAGAFLGTYNNTVNVDQFEFGFSVFILCMVIIGGMGNIWGVILGAIALSMINRYLLPELNGVPDKVGLSFDVTSINFGIFGFLLLVMMVLRPEGLLPSTRRRLELRESEIDEEDHIGTESDHQYYEVRGQ